MPPTESATASIYPEKNTIKSYIAANPLVILFVGFIVGTFGAACIRLALNNGMPPIMISGVRLFSAWLIFLPVVMRRYRAEVQAMSRQDMVLAATAGVMIYINFTSIATAFKHTSLMISHVLFNTAPIWVAALETVLLKAQLPKIVFVGLIFVMIGGGFIAFSSLNETEAENTSPEQTTTITEDADAEDDRNPTFGAAMALISAFGSAAYLIIGRKVRAKTSLVPYVWFVYGGGALAGMLTILFTRTVILGYSLEAYFWLVMVIITIQLITHTIINYAVGHIPATIVSLATQSTTIFTAILAFILFAEVPQKPELIGSVVIVAGVVLAIRGQMKANGRTSNA